MTVGHYVTDETRAVGYNGVMRHSPSEQPPSLHPPSITSEISATMRIPNIWHSINKCINL